MIPIIASADYPGGVQYEWCAIDDAGHIALFNTAGYGPVPTKVLRSPLAGVHESLVALEANGGAEVPAGRNFDQEFVDFARRGLFPFDWEEAGQPYTNPLARYLLQATPTRPAKLAELALPPEIYQALESMRLPLEFRSVRAIAVSALGQAMGEMLGLLRGW